ncbi:MAG: ribosomal RNA small subunit methyltransferase A [Saprospiraceae bacterium]|nr:ribosomal RNA small subunit methyltransferase A [Saprospiraceae bacterium]
MKIAKKSFGQHFLTDQNIIQRIIKLVDQQALQNICEIGPGRAALSKHLLHRIPRYTLVEADHDMVAYLEKNYAILQPHVIQKDFLKLDMNLVFPNEDYLLFGNFPYNISSQIVIRTLENSPRIPLMLGMFQKEMALRIVSGFGSKDYGPLSILSSYMYERKILFDIDPLCFLPPPKVMSSFIELKRKENPMTTEKYYKIQPFIRASFQFRRKTLRNNLKGFVRNVAALEDPYFTIRPEDVAPEMYLELYDRLMILV